MQLDQKLEMKDGETGLYPFMEAAMMTNCRLDTLYTIMIARHDLLEKE